MRTHRAAPRVLIANSNPVPARTTWERFWALECAGLMMYGQMTAARGGEVDVLLSHGISDQRFGG